MATDVLRIPLRVVFYRDRENWVAHCLEFDLMGDGATQPEAARRLSEAISMQLDVSIEQNNPDNLFTPADGKVFRMFAAGRDITATEVTLPAERDDIVIENTACRQYEGPALVPA